MKRFSQIIVAVALLVSIAIGQTPFMRLTPGKSSSADVSKVLGEPVAKISETLFEYRAKDTSQKVYVQYRKDADVIDRLEVLFDRPVSRSSLAGMLGLPAKAETVKWDAKGRMEEYFGTDTLIVITHESSEDASAVIRVGYYSQELFEAALKKPTGKPKTPEPASAAVPVGVKSEMKSFKDIDLLVPKGDKSETKSVRLLFDRGNLILDGDRGEKIYKQFPYAQIVSGEYSYSTSPRWKEAVGAALLIGVFAVPILFMKSKKHWLTVKTANDFAILRLDKDNYKMVLATFETSTGQKVQTVNEGK
jgi:hypothetical protein